MMQNNILKTLTASIFLTLSAAINTFAAGPAKVATYDRNLWPQELNDVQGFNRASLYENLMFSSVVKTLPKWLLSSYCFLFLVANSKSELVVCVWASLNMSGNNS